MYAYPKPNLFERGRQNDPDMWRRVMRGEPIPKREKAPSKSMQVREDIKGKKRLKQRVKGIQKDLKMDIAQRKGREEIQRVKQRAETRKGNPPGSRSGVPELTSALDTQLSFMPKGARQAMKEHYNEDYRSERDMRRRAQTGPRSSMHRDDIKSTVYRRPIEVAQRLWGQQVSSRVFDRYPPGSRDPGIMTLRGRRKVKTPDGWQYLDA